MIDIQTVDHVAFRVGSIADAIMMLRENDISAQRFSLPVEADAITLRPKARVPFRNTVSVVTGFDVLIFAFRDGETLRSRPYSGRTYVLLASLTPARH